MVQRKPAVAHQFYEGEADRLERQLDRLIPEGLEKSAALGVVSPHAGYIYSGKVAGAVFARVEASASYVILGPNHRGRGSSAGITSQGEWLMPWGSVPLDQDLAAGIMARCDLVTEDPLSHLHEHSLEVQIPFIHRVAPQAAIVPLALSVRDYSRCEDLGEAIAEAIVESGRRVTIVASTDMTHYEPHEVATRKDKPAIDAIVALDPRGLYDYVVSNRVTMCGLIPTVVMLLAAVKLGATAAELIQYSTSGETSGDYQQVVGYAGLIVS